LYIAERWGPFSASASASISRRQSCEDLTPTTASPSYPARTDIQHRRKLCGVPSRQQRWLVLVPSWRPVDTAHARRNRCLPTRAPPQAVLRLSRRITVVGHFNPVDEILIGAGLACPASTSNKEVRGGKHDPRYEHKYARKKHNVDDDLCHGTLPTHPRPHRWLRPLLKLGGMVTAGYPKFGQRLSMRSGSRLFRALHMLNTSNVTSPMPPNSAASATESYSSQCQYVSTISFPCYHHFFLGSDRGGGSGPARKLMSPGCLLYCLGLPWRPSSGG
jgi:hypothetical protein